jgi:hypothetical protein
MTRARDGRTRRRTANPHRRRVAGPTGHCDRVPSESCSATVTSARFCQRPWWGSRSLATSWSRPMPSCSTRQTGPTYSGSQAATAWTPSPGFRTPLRLCWAHDAGEVFSLDVTGRGAVHRSEPTRDELTCVSRLRFPLDRRGISYEERRCLRSGRSTTGVPWRGVPGRRGDGEADRAGRARARRERGHRGVLPAKE